MIANDTVAPAPASGRWRLGNAELDERTMRLTVGGQIVPLDRSGCALLLHLALSAGETASKDALLRAGWPGRVVTENSLTKAIGRLRQALRDANGERLQVVHGYGYRLVAEMRAEAIDDAKEDGSPPLPRSVTPRSALPPAAGRRWWSPVLVGTILVFALIGLVQFASHAPQPAVAIAPSGPQPPPVPSIAVLPFLDLSESQDQVHFSDGLAEQLLDSLARLPQMHVVGRTSSFAFRGKDLDIPTIGRKLNARNVLEGSVRRSGDRIRVTVQLINAADGYHLWSNTYDRPVTELFALQDDIVRAIVSALRIELLPEQQRELVRHATDNAQAFEEYLLAHYVFKDDETAHRRSIAHFERAVALDPQFIDAWLGLADVLGHSGMYADNAAEALAGKRRALEILDRAAALAPNRADIHIRRGTFRCAHWWDWSGAEQDFAQAAALGAGDDPEYLVELGRLRAATGHLSDAIDLERRASQIAPASGNAWTVMGYHYTALAQFEPAHDVLSQSVRNVPLDEHAHYYLGLDELLQGRPSEALPHFEDSAHVLRLTGLAMAHYSLNDTAASEQDLQVLIARYGHILPYQAAEVYAWRGEQDKAFEWLDRAYELHDASFIYYVFDPLLRNLHGDARYAALLKKLGLSPVKS